MHTLYNTYMHTGKYKSFGDTFNRTEISEAQREVHYCPVPYYSALYCTAPAHCRYSLLTHLNLPIIYTHTHSLYTVYLLYIHSLNLLSVCGEEDASRELGGRSECEGTFYYSRETSTFPHGLVLVLIIVLLLVLLFCLRS